MVVMSEDIAIIFTIIEKARLPTPLKINYFWGNGSILGVIYTLQVISGILLASLYTTGDAFLAVDIIMRDVLGGWFLRYFHATGASALFLFLIFHMGRGIYYRSYHTQVYTWLWGVIMLLLFMASAFVGYVLPWGQMSFWGATVITKFLSVIPGMGESITFWLWGSFGVGETTLIRFFTFHIVLPLVGVPLIMLHLASLHSYGSSNPLGTKGVWSSFLVLFMVKDMLGFIIFGGLFVLFICWLPTLPADAANFIEADSLSTPTHIKPEWYYLFAYAMLRSVPKKVGGIMAMVGSILIFALLPFLYGLFPMNGPSRKTLVWVILSVFLILTWLGGQPAEAPYVELSQIFTFFYFFLFFLI